MEFFKTGSRITKQWTNTTAEAFGQSEYVLKGRQGELFVMDVLRSWGWDVIDHEDNKQMQLKQIDMEFKDPKWFKHYSGSIKTNMDDDGNIFVYDHWINISYPDRVFHCNVNTGWICWYDTKLMQQYFENNIHKLVTNKRGQRYLKIAATECRSFIKRRKQTVSYGG